MCRAETVNSRSRFPPQMLAAGDRRALGQPRPIRRPSPGLARVTGWRGCPRLAEPRLGSTLLL